MRITIFTDTFSPTINGVATSVVNYAGELVKRNYKVLIIAPGHPDFKYNDTFDKSGIEIKFISSIDAKFQTDLRLALPSVKVFQKVNRFKPDIIHTFTPGFLGIEGILIAKHLNIPAVSSHLTNYTDIETLKSFGVRGKNLGIYLQKGAGWFIVKFLNEHRLILVPTEDTKRDLIKLGVSKQIELVKLPVPVKEFKKAKVKGQNLKKRLGIELSLLYVGRLSGEKNLDILIRAFNTLRKTKKQLKLVLVGDGPAREELFTLANNLSCLESIVWVGKKNYTEVMKQGYYYLGTVFVSTSSFETQGLSTVEAMSCGLPVVTMAARGSQEVVQDNGVLIRKAIPIEISKTIQELLQDSTQLKKLSQKSLRASLEYDISICTNRLELVYQDLIK